MWRYRMKCIIQKSIASCNGFCREMLALLFLEDIVILFENNCTYSCLLKDVIERWLYISTKHIFHGSWWIHLEKFQSINDSLHIFRDSVGNILKLRLLSHEVMSILYKIFEGVSCWCIAAIADDFVYPIHPCDKIVTYDISSCFVSHEIFVRYILYITSNERLFHITLERIYFSIEQDYLPVGTYGPYI